MNFCSETNIIMLIEENTVPIITFPSLPFWYFPRPLPTSRNHGSGVDVHACTLAQVAEEYGISEEELQSLQEATQASTGAE